MMNRRQNIQRYAKFAYAAVTKCTTSAGQTSFCMDAASHFLFKNAYNPTLYYFSGLAILAGFLVNTTLKLPIIYQHYVDTHDQSNTNETYQLKWVTSKSLYYFLIVFGFISAEISDPLNAYLGSIIIMENIFGIASIDIHDSWSKEMIIQVYAVFSAIGIAFANYAYDFRFINGNIQTIAELVDKREFKFNKAVFWTLIFSLPVMIGAPVLNFLFTQPAIEKIPGANLVLNEVMIQILAVLIAVAAFVRCLASLPSIYSTFDNYHDPNKRSIVNEFPRNCKTILFRFNAGVSGLIDSIASGLCMLVSVISIAHIIFKLPDESSYDWTLFAFAIFFALSQAIQNALFALYPGYRETLKLFKTNSVESLPIVNTSKPIKSTLLNYGSQGSVSRAAPSSASVQVVEDDEDQETYRL